MLTFLQSRQKAFKYLTFILKWWKLWYNIIVNIVITQMPGIIFICILLCYAVIIFYPDFTFTTVIEKCRIPMCVQKYNNIIMYRPANLSNTGFAFILPISWVHQWSLNTVTNCEIVILFLSFYSESWFCMLHFTAKMTWTTQ